MAVRLSRRKIAEYYAKELVKGANIGTLTTSLAAFLIKSKRVKELDLIVRDVEYQLSLNGLVLASVVSARALTDQTRQAIVELVGRQTGANDVQLVEDVDPSLLGGLILDFAGLELDTSLEKQLTQLKTNHKK